MRETALTAGERLSRVLKGTWIWNIETEKLSETTRAAATRVPAAAWRPDISIKQQEARAAVFLETAWRLIVQRRRLEPSHHLHGRSGRGRERRDRGLDGEGRERGQRARRGRSARRRQLRLSR